MVSGKVGMTMVVKVTGGQGTKITALFIMFQNPKSKYPICGVPDDIPGIPYDSATNGFMTSKVFAL
jgi:hypothetical protein